MAANLLLPAIKGLASGMGKKAAAGAAKNFVSGKNRKGKEGSSVKSGKDYEKQVGGGRGSAIVPTTPIVGSYRVETVSDKPNEVGKPSKVNYETINCRASTGSERKRNPRPVVSWPTRWASARRSSPRDYSLH